MPLELDCHQLLGFIEKVKGPLAARVEADIDILELVTTGLVGGVEVDVTVIVFDEPIRPGFEESFSTDQALLIDRDLLAE